MVGWHYIVASLWTTTAIGFQTPTHAQVEVFPDSQQILSAAKSAQRRFERTRRRHLPWTYPRSGPCDLRIGRICLWDLDGNDEDDWFDPEEDPVIGAARTELIALLDSAAAAIPGDEWIAGQRVRYLVEAGDIGGALTATSECQAAPWWCSALTGYAYHANRRFALAEQAFIDALLEMNEETRCEWSDLSRILDGDLRSRYRDLDCAERAPLQRRILWLADPFHSVDGNELATEHYSRQVYSALLKEAESPEGGRWGGDMHRFVMRYGWTHGWERVRTNASSQLRPSIRWHQAHGAKYFLPTADILDRPADTEPSEWNLEPHLPRAGHAPAYALRAFHTLAHQVAGFRRGDSLILATTFELIDDSVPPDAEIQAALVFTADEFTPPLIVREVFHSNSGAIATTVPNTAQLMSYELLAPEQQRAARARFGIEPSRLLTIAPPLPSDTAGGPLPHFDALARPALSGILITAVRDSLPESLDEAIAAARPNTRMRPGERFGLYWELYGAGAAVHRITTSLTLTKQGKSLFKRIVGVFGLGSDKPPVSLEWIDAPSPDSNMYPRAVAVDLPANLPDGSYQLRLQVVFQDGRSMEVEKGIEVRRER